MQIKMINNMKILANGQEIIKQEINALTIIVKKPTYLMNKMQ